MSRGMNSGEASKFFDKWIEEGVMGAYNDRVRKTGLVLVRQIVKACPVDTGRFKGSWDIEIDRWPTGTPLGPEGTGGNSGQASRASNSRASKAVAELKTATKIPEFVGVANNLPYGPVLEYGRAAGGSGRSGGQVLVAHSQKQNPGFVRAAVEGVRSMLRSGKL